MKKQIKNNVEATNEKKKTLGEEVQNSKEVQDSEEVQNSKEVQDLEEVQDSKEVQDAEEPAQVVPIESLVYEADEIRKILRLGRTTTYEFLNDVYEKGVPFKVFKIGKLIRIQKESFDEWIKAV